MLAQFRGRFLRKTGFGGHPFLLEEVAQEQQILRSDSFAEKVTDKSELQAAISTHK
jgi:uncharacterized protein involved in exopolysaccharide biosynthesis